MSELSLIWHRGLNGKSVDLDWNNKQIAQGFDPEKSSILCAADRGFEILKVVVLGELFCFVRVVQVTNEPISSVLENIPLDAADLLGCVH